MKVSAQIAGEELERIYQENGELDPAHVVEESRPENAPLHPCFEWNDAVAAEKYREYQAQSIIQNVTVETEHLTTDAPIRAFVHVQNTYMPVDIVLNDAEKAEELLMSALRELKSFQRKYNSLSSLQPVFEAIQEVCA